METIERGAPPAAARPRVGAAVLPAVVAAACLAFAGRAAVSGFDGSRDVLARGVIPVLVGLVVGALVVLRPAHRAGLTALIVSTGATLYGLEAALRAFVPENTPVVRVLRARAAGVHYDARSVFEVLDGIRRRGVRAYPFVQPQTLLTKGADGLWHSPVHVEGREIYPLSGIAGVHTLMQNESGAFPEYESDEHGFNNPPGAWAEAPASVVLVGDSFTQGCGVPPEQNMTAPIRARFPRTVNLGIAHTGPLAELGTLREYGPLLRPRVVLWNFFFGNDFADLEVEKRSLLAGYLDPGFRQGLAGMDDALGRELGAIVDAAQADEERVLPRARHFVGLQRVRGVTGLGQQATPQATLTPDLPLLRRVLDRARQDVEAWGGRLVFVYLPAWETFAKKPLDDHHDEVLAIARELGLETIDLRATFEKQPDPLSLFPYRLEGHYDALGYRVAGEALAGWLGAADQRGW